MNASHFISTQYRNIFFHTFHWYFSCFTTKIENHNIFYFSSSSGCYVIIVCIMNYGIALQNNNLEHLQPILHLRYVWNMFLLITCFIWRNATVIYINRIEWCENWPLSVGFLCLCCYWNDMRHVHAFSKPENRGLAALVL